MNNIYDVILNFNEVYYEVYEWKSTDDIINVRKISFLKVDDATYNALKYNEVKVSTKTLEDIKYNCLMYEEDVADITCLVTNGKSSMGIIIDLDGNVIKRSAMVFEEEDEVVEEARNIKETKVEFIVNKPCEFNNKSRIEIEKKKVLLDFINNTNDKMILKYIYYDYYLRECDDIDKIKMELLAEVNKDIDEDLLRLYNLVVLFVKCC